MSNVNDVLAQVTTADIETLPQHYAAFAYKHPLEAKFPTQMITPDWYVGGEMREIYGLDNPIFGKVSIDVTGIKRGLALGTIPMKMRELTLTQAWVDYVLKTCGVEEEGVLRLTPRDLRRPGIIIQWTPKGDHVTQVDGNHRLVARWRVGLKTWQYAHVIAPDVSRYVVRPGDEGRFFDTPEPPDRASRE